jgi:hypothetical protein
MSSALLLRLSLDGVGVRLACRYFLTPGASLLAFAIFLCGARAHTLHWDLLAALEVGIHRLAADPRAIASCIGRDALLLVLDRPDHVLFQSSAFARTDRQSARRFFATMRDRTLLVVPDTINAVPTRVAALNVDRPGSDAVVVQTAPGRPAPGTSCRSL